MGTRGAFILLAFLAFAACDEEEGPISRRTPTPHIASAPEATASVASAQPAAPRFGLTLAPRFTPAPPLSPRRTAKLAADLVRITELAKHAPEAPSHVRPVAGTFLIAPGDPAAPVDAAADLARRIVDFLYSGPFQHRPDEATLVWVHTTQAGFERGFRALPKAPDEPPAQLEYGTIGLYDDFARTVLVRTDAAGVGSIAHELLHPLAEADGPRMPNFAIEGLSAAFEVPDFSRPGEVHFRPHFRLQSLRDALQSSNTDVAGDVGLMTVFGLAARSVREGPRGYLHYAEAREFLRWLDHRGKLWAFWSLCRDNILLDSSCMDAFERVMGKAPVDATSDWIAWIQSPEAEEVP